MTQPSTSPRCSLENLTLFHYGELEEAERLRVENHLQQCVACRRELEQLRSTLAKLPPEEREFSAEELRAFHQRLNRRLGSRQRLPLRPAVGWSLAAATAVLLLVTLHAPSPPSGPAPPGATQVGDVTRRLPDPELLLNMELLEKLDMLQELEGPGVSG
jgi:anti-sigma factor RsiW